MGVWSIRSFNGQKKQTIKLGYLEGAKKTVEGLTS